MLGLGLSLPNVAVRARASAPPPIVLDFTAATLPQQVTLTRASAGRLVEATGLIGTRAANVARLTHHPVSLAPLGHLFEPTATNLMRNSETFTAATWVRNGAFVPAQVTLANGLSGTSFVADTYNRYGIYNATAAAWIVAPILRPAPIDGRTAVTFTAPVGCTSVRFYPLRTTMGIDGVYGTITVTPGQTYTISWYEETGKLGGVQIEWGAQASSYIATTSASVTRAADLAGLQEITGVYNVTLTYDDLSQTTLPATTVSAGYWPTLARPILRSMSLQPIN